MHTPTNTQPQVALCDRQRNPSCRLSSMFDLSNCSLSNMDAAVMNNILGVLSTHYVERLSVLYFYNPPSLFWGLWNASKHLLPEVGGGGGVFCGWPSCGGGRGPEEAWRFVRRANEWVAAAEASGCSRG